VLFFLLPVSVALGSAAPARAQLWQSAQVLAPLSFSVGAFGSFVYIPAADFMGYAQVKMGLGAGLDLELRAGAGSLPWTAGAFLKWQFLSSDILDLAVWGGYHYQTASQASLAIVLSHAFDRLDLYVAPLLQVAVDSTGVRIGGGAVPGFALGLAQWMKLYVEFTIGTSPVLNSGSIGAKFYL
jgi:hypothetical protein